MNHKEGWQGDESPKSQAKGHNRQTGKETGRKMAGTPMAKTQKSIWQRMNGNGLVKILLGRLGKWKEVCRTAGESQVKVMVRKDINAARQDS